MTPNVGALYTNDNWEVRRRLLFRLIWWKIIAATAIMLIAAVTGSENAILQLALPSLLAAIATESGLYIFGANADDKDKRERLPKPVIDNDAGDEVPEDFAT